MPAGSSDGRPLVFAHRGASAHLPEHTLAAYRRALVDGADGLECDVRMTTDGHLVCLHDARLERTSDGRGKVSDHSLAELGRLDFGSWHPALPDSPDELIFDRRSPGQEQPILDDRGRVLTLDRLIGAAREAARPVRLLVETKHPSPYGGAVERGLVTLLDRHGLLDPKPDEWVRVTVMSFSPLAVRKVRELAPTLPTVLLLDRLPGLPVTWLPFGVKIAGPGIALVRSRPMLVRRLRERGHQVYVWTVNEPTDIDLVLELGVEGIISDRPADVLARL